MNRTRILLLFLALVAALAAFTYFSNESDSSTKVAKNNSPLSADLPEQWTKIRAAEREKDLTQRCLAYPDAPWLHWSPKLVAAFCGSMSETHISAAEMMSALESGHAEKLDQAFQSYFDDNFGTPPNHTTLTNKVRAAFGNTEADTKHIVQQWVALAPKSAFALQARGYYYLAAAWDARGEDFVRDTSDESLRLMHEFAGKANADFAEALSLNPRLISAYSGMMRVAQLVGDRTLIERAAQAGLALDPADSRIYLDWMTASEPRWGGSIEQMSRIAKLASEHIDENPILNLVVVKPSGYEATAFQNRGDDTSALKALEGALVAAPSGDYLSRAGQAANKTKQYEKAIWYFSEARRFRGEDLDDLSARAYVLIQVGHADWAKETLANVSLASAHDPWLANVLWRLKMVPEAERVYLNILEHNPRDKYALTSLSRLYLQEPIRHEKAQPLVDRLIEVYPDYARGWLLNAVGKPDAECHQALKKYLELVDPNDPEEKDDIARVKKRIGELESAGPDTHTR